MSDWMQAVDTFLEELIVRGGLAENFCHYQPNYDNLNGAWSWARESLMIHATDKREVLYTYVYYEALHGHGSKISCLRHIHICLW